MITYNDVYSESLEYFNQDELAANVFVSKYALKNKDEYLETTPDDMFRRISTEFARIEFQKFDKTNIKPLTYDEIYNLLKDFKYIIPQGSPLFGIGNYHQYISLSNCFVLESPDDSYGGILKTDQELVQISKRRGGIGLDISKLRPEGMPTSNASRTSTGIIPFMQRYSNSINEVGQNGRRGALMMTIDCHHPQVEDFIESKVDLKKITGANISVKLSNEFLNAVKNKEKYELRFPIDYKERGIEPLVSKLVDANEVWTKIIKNAHASAEPGILFWDNIINNSPADSYASLGFSTVSTNPCGEIPLSPYDSCRLMVLNLFSYVDNPFSKTPFFNYPLFSKHVQYAQRLMDDLIDLEIEHIDRIIEKIDKDPESDEIKLTEKDLWVKIRKAARLGRRTGLGLTALGDTLAALNVGYATDGSLIDVDNIYKSLMIHSYRASVEMAKEIGPFPIWNSSLEKDNEFILRIKDCDEQLYNDMKLYGRRNISCNTSAPVGSVSLISQTTSGIEPLFMMSYKRRKKLNSTESDIVPDFIDQNDIRWKEFDVYHPKLKLWMDITGETDIAKSPWHGFCADDINWKKRVELQATAQKYIDHSISSTLNLPESATIDDIKMIYETAWESGCKGVTVYRKNSRSGVLIDTTTKKDTNDIVKTTAPKRPKSINAEVYHFKILKENYNVVVGLLNKEPYEIFVSKYDVYSDNTCIPKEVKDGKIVKMKRGHYELITENKNYIISGETLDETVESLTRMISISLRHGVDISFIVQQLEKTKGDLYSFSKALSRALKKYIKDGVKVSGDNCPECNSNNLIREDGCIKCSNCGFSKC